MNVLSVELRVLCVISKLTLSCNYYKKQTCFILNVCVCVCVCVYMGHAVAQLVEALRYKPEGRGLDSLWCHWISGRTMALGSTQPLTEMNTRNVSWG